MSYTPQKPFDEYKWFFATKAPTEALGDPALLLGLIKRIAPLSNTGITYSSNEFAQIMADLNKDIHTTVNLAERVGQRNLMRNSAQYWKLFGLIPQDSKGKIVVTNFANDIVNGKISQIDFASTMIVSLTLPNQASYQEKDYYKWKDNELLIHPFKLILKIMRILNNKDTNQGYLTNQELYSVIIPMAGDKQKPELTAEYVLKYRQDSNIINGWYNAVPESNDKRFTAEFLRFLANFGFIEKQNKSGANRDTTKYFYINDLDEQILTLIDGSWSESQDEILRLVRNLDIDNAVIQNAIYRTNSRPRQRQFRSNLIQSMIRCPITGIDLKNVLQAAHIKPYAYEGSDDISNGLLLRADIHILFDSGLLNLRPDDLQSKRCFLELSQDEKVISNYRELIGKSIHLPEFIDMDNIIWRYENSLLGVSV
ncbi:HNH endonuclease signature motif containing protein [Glaesserella parasuis]|uniref:HNH endonuclease n=1 Tax=Glaesserella parasuis TaxID=738 RepID=UPI00094F55DD|nr:HNH endonuclease signature motif containing protein [Glaesserella parasuis]MDP0377505.1 HNH endonuclease signature motif containing protein [Glaesserella parasuis]